MSAPAVSVEGLTKVFRGYRREEGLAAALKSLVQRQATETVAVSGVTFAVAPPSATRITQASEPPLRKKSRTEKPSMLSFHSPPKMRSKSP